MPLKKISMRVKNNFQASFRMYVLKHTKQFLKQKVQNIQIPKGYRIFSISV